MKTIQWPQARDLAFPTANFLLAKVVLWIGIGTAVGVFVQGFPWKAIIGVAAALPIVFSEVPPPKTLETSATGKQMITWLEKNTSTNATIVSSYETAPLVWLAERNWQQWPTKWEERGLITHVLVSNLDNFWTASSEFKPNKLNLEIVFQTPQNSIYLYAIEEKP